MCYIQVKNIRLNSFYEKKKIKLCLTKQLLNMFKLWCEWGISIRPYNCHKVTRKGVNGSNDSPVALRWSARLLQKAKRTEAKKKLTTLTHPFF